VKNPDSKLAACKTETEENHGERGAARSSRRESRLGSRACDGNQVENGKRRRRFTRKGNLNIVGAKPSENRKWNPSAARNPRKRMAARGWKKPMLPTLALQPWAGPQHAREEPEIDEKKESITEKSTRIMRPRPTLRIKRKISDLAQTRHKMQTRNISLRSKQSLHPIHGGLRPPTLFLIETKLAHSKN
jgi:hypothetical protein